MSFLAPLALLGAAILGPLIVAMYVLKLRREERTISSTFLWQRTVRDVEANAPWQKLRFNWLLLLQLLLLLLLLLALARPFFTTQGITGRNLVLIIDRSASMGATDVGASRLQAAKDQALTLIDQLPDGGRATVIAAGGQMEVLASATTDQRELRQAVNDISLSVGGTSDMAQALTLASALVAREEGSELAILSDGNISIPEDLEVPAMVRYFPVGQSADNTAISAMVLQPAAAGQTLFVQVTNYGPDAADSRRLDVYLDGELFNAYSINLEPGGERSIIAEVPPQVEVAEARLSENDTLAIDDQAWAVSSAGTTTNVRIVTAGNRFLETAIDLLPGIESRTVPASTSTFEETAAQVPVTILDGVVPANLPPGNLLFIAPPRSTDAFSITGQIDFPGPQPAPGDEPLLRNVSLSELNVLEAVDLVPASWLRVVVDSDSGPLLLAGEHEGRRVVVLTFDLHLSDLPLQVAFPLLLSNMMTFLAPETGAEAAQLAPGEPLALRIDPAIDEVRLTRPDGTTLSTDEGGIFEDAPPLEIQNNQLVYADTVAPGVYTLEELRNGELEARHRYAVNVFAPAESDIGPQQELAIMQSSGLQTAITRDSMARQEFWRWLAAAALLVLVVEWLVYQRNTLAALRDRWRNRGQSGGPLRSRSG
jgi:hypothetical protein